MYFIKEKNLTKDIFINIHQISTGFIEIPNQVSLNIYAQGCEKKCIGCQNPELQKFEGGTKIFISDIDKILSDYSLSKWICWLGGDAVYQPDEFMRFNKNFKKRNMNICLYTGKKFEEIKNLVHDVDLVIDGEWNGKSIKDSDTNQTIWIKRCRA